MKLTKPPYFTKSNYFVGSILNFSRLFDAIEIWIPSLYDLCVRSVLFGWLRVKCVIHTLFFLFVANLSHKHNYLSLFVSISTTKYTLENAFFITPIQMEQFTLNSMHSIFTRNSRTRNTWIFLHRNNFRIYFHRSFLMHVCTDLGLLDNWLGRRIVSIEHSTVCYYVLLVLFVYFPQHFFSPIVCYVDSIFLYARSKHPNKQ